MNNNKVFGLLLLVGSLGFIFAMNVAEFLFPGYSVSNNYISDLGAMCRAGSCRIIQPSSTIFNTSIILLGIAIIAASIIMAMPREGPKLFPSLFAISGVGAIMVGLFPEYTGSLHSISALIVFLFGGLAAIASYKLQGSPMNIISIILGLLTLSSLALYVTGHYLGLGPGGMERMIVYPALLWGAAFGAYMVGRADS
ncbi:membrane protein [Thermocladium modestius]|uniref:Membrane protein n=1 Tax=Thermocladium modestius TaxID=62609 RepID=A0A830GW73_9CREN|nr:DUF998 domain-containing protein [Thermocladium modestius]GGP21996.1 membrane protein [Thermocladium modestius]